MASTRASVCVTELLDGEVVFATWLIGLIDSQNYFYGLKKSISNLCENDQVVVIDMSNEKWWCCGTHNRYVDYTLETGTQPLTDSRISIIEMTDLEQFSAFQIALVEAFDEYDKCCL